MTAGKLRQVLTPTLFVLLMMATCKIVYNSPLYAIIPGAHKYAALIVGLMLNISITFGPSVVYPLARNRGASVTLSGAAALLTPTAWNIWEVVRVTEYFSPVVSIYYGFNSLFLGSLAFAVFQIGVWEFFIRLRSKKEPEKRRLLTPLAASVAGLAAVYVMLFWSMGAHWFYMYGNVYKTFFH